MSRVPYEVHRARKRASSHMRAGSETPTETEFDFDGASSLASYSTHVTSSSYRQSGPSLSYPPSSGADLRRRALSPSGSASPQFSLHSPPLSQNGPMSAGAHSLFPHRQSSSRPGSSSREYQPAFADSLAPAPDARRRSSRTGETDEERRVRREKRRAERSARGPEGEDRRAVARSSKLAHKKEREEEEERRYGSTLRNWVKWSMWGGAEGDRWKGLGWGLGGVLVLRLAVVLVIGLREYGPSSHGGQAELSGSIPPLHRLAALMYQSSPTKTHDSMQHSRADLAQNQALSLHLPALLLEMAILWTGVIMWVKLEGRWKGRSWRTQLTGILTFLLQPALIYTAAQTPLTPLFLGLAIWALIFLTRSQDILGVTAVALALGPANSPGPARWTLLPGVGSFLLGKGVWLGGSRGMRHVVSALLVFATSSMIAGPATSSAALLWTGRPLGRDVIRAFLQSGLPWLPAHLATSAEHVRSHWVRCLLTAACQLPTIIIALYTAFSTRIPTSAAPAGEPPLTNLLPLILATSALPIYLLSSPATSTAESGDALFPLSPLTLMMGLRGEDESWDVGVLISNVAMFRMRPGYASGLASASTTLVLLGTHRWNRFIGHSPARWRDSSWVRRAGYAVYVIFLTVVVLELAQHTTLPAQYHIFSVPSAWWAIPTKAGAYLSTGILWVTWVWAVRKLVESAWAMGGFSGSETGGKRSPGGVEIQVIDAT